MAQFHPNDLARYIGLTNPHYIGTIVTIISELLCGKLIMKDESIIYGSYYKIELPDGPKKAIGGGEICAWSQDLVPIDGYSNKETETVEKELELET